MERLDVELDPPVEGIAVVGLFQPSYKHKDFVLSIRQTLYDFLGSPKFKSMQENLAAMRASNGIVEDANSGGEDKQEIYPILKLTGDLGSVMGKFADMLQDPKVAQANGGPLPANFANKLTIDQFEKLFVGYVNFFIAM